MSTVQDILKEKGTTVHRVSPKATVLEATREMNNHRIGALIVSEGDRLVGMFTERDVLSRVVAEERLPSKVSVREVMTVEVACCTPKTTIEEARSVMKHRRIRHLPVVDDSSGELLGMISIGDLNGYHIDGQETTIHLLNEYLYGRV